MEYNMEMKWMWITVMAMMLGMYAGLALEEHYKTECRIVALQAGKNSTDIAAICK